MNDMERIEQTMNRVKRQASRHAGRTSTTLDDAAVLRRARRAAGRGDLSAAIGQVEDLLAQKQLPALHALQARKALIGWYEALDMPERCRSVATEGAAELRAHLGPRHEATLIMRHSELYWMCMSGFDDVARTRFPALIRDIEKTLGRAHELAWAARTNSAMPLKRAGDFRRAAQVYRNLLQDMNTTLDPTDSIVLTTRDNLAEALACDGRFEESTRLYEDLLSDMLGLHSPGDPRVLRLRDEIASNIFSAGDVGRARELWAVLAEDCRRHLGECAPETARQRTLQVALALQDDDDVAVVRWCRLLLDNLPEGLDQDDAEGFRTLLEHSAERLERAGGAV